ncbi:hypothetical protein [Halorarum halobium]|uniref:hypothetical protein n=1 Tax=Halorarum halobium TaxID=3075121 RepID=UPI0028B102FD|nr:hypothetical protein [Halobaculum sp. XH14]
MTVTELLTEDVIEALASASARGVPIKVGEMSDSVENEIGEELLDAELFDSLWEWSDTPAGRLLMIDTRKTLASVLAESDSGPSAEAVEETAIWRSGTKNSLVTVLRAVFTWKLDGTRAGE